MFGQELAPSLSFQLVVWAGAIVLILRCVQLGEMPHPPPGAQLIQTCLSCEGSVPWWTPSPRHVVT